MYMYTSGHFWTRHECDLSHLAVEVLLHRPQLALLRTTALRHHLLRQEVQLRHLLHLLLSPYRHKLGSGRGCMSTLGAIRA